MWTPIVGKKFSIADFAAYVATLGLAHAGWRPSFIVLHNTGSPNRKQYDSYALRNPPITDEQWAHNLADYYQSLGWEAGPHAFVVPSGVIAFTPLTHRGTHTPSWNYCSWGIEMVGDYDPEEFPSDIRDNAVAVLGILHRAAGLSPVPFELGRHGLHFHHDDPRTTHRDCPGKHVVKPDIVDRVRGYMETLEAQGHPPDRAAAVEQKPTASTGGDLAAKIAKAMTNGHYPLATGPGELNIVYVEGMNTDGTANAFRPNAFDCVRVLLSTPADGPAKIVGIWEATTHAGLYWETHRMNPAGAFHIRLGQQTAWVMGQYHVQTALLQARPLEGTRDGHNDFKREGPPVKGDFGVHHHWGYDYPKDNAGNSSAGCQVGRTKAGHNEFIALLKGDPRYVKDHGFVWSSTVLTAAEVLAV